MGLPCDCQHGAWSTQVLGVSSATMFTACSLKFMEILMILSMY